MWGVEVSAMKNKSAIENKVEALLQQGRSMVEMIGVLAIMGVLAVGGIVGIRYALQIRAENETVNDFNIAVAGARTLDLKYAEKGPVNVRLITSVPEQNMKGDYFVTNTISPVMVNVENNGGYTVRIAGISKPVCEQIKYGTYGETCALIGPTYTDCGDTKLEDIDCDIFDDIKTEEEKNERKSALQLSGQTDIDFETAALNYESLILYFGPLGLLVSEDEEEESGGNGDDDSDTEDPNTSDTPDDDIMCVTYTPFMDGPILEECESCCKQAGGRWSRAGGLCCVASNKKYTEQADDGVWEARTGGTVGNAFVGNAENAGCCDATLLSENSGCCRNAGHEWVSGTCCEISGGQRTGLTTDGNPADVCIPAGSACSNRCFDGRWPTEINGVCCCGAKDNKGAVNETCCENAGFMWVSGVDSGGTCCELSGNVLTGKDYAGNASAACASSPNPDGNCTTPCPDGSPAQAVDGVCCCGETDVSGEANQTCCEKNGNNGEWHDGVCCMSPCAWNAGAQLCCSNNLQCPDGKNPDSAKACLGTCPQGTESVIVDSVQICCGENSSKAYGLFGNELEEEKYMRACCERLDGTFYYNENPQYLEIDKLCCKTGSSFNIDKQKRDSLCCKVNGGTWMGSWCCAEWSWQLAGQGGGMCHKP